MKSFSSGARDAPRENYGKEKKLQTGLRPFPDSPRLGPGPGGAWPGGSGPV